MNRRTFIASFFLASAACLFCDVTRGAPPAQVVRKAGELAAKAAKNGLADDALRLAPLLMGLFGKLAGVVAVVSAGIYVRDEKRKQAELIAYLVAVAGGAWTAYAWLGLPFVRQAGAPHGWVAGLGWLGQDAVALSFTGLLGLAGFAAIGACISALIARAGLADEKR